jgi:hypothetical protein
MKLVLDKLSKVYHVIMEDDSSKSTSNNNNNNNNNGATSSTISSTATENLKANITQNEKNTSKIYNQQVLVTHTLANTGIGL